MLRQTSGCTNRIAQGYGNGRDLTEYGILPRAEVKRICEARIASTIGPGLARYGIAFNASV